MLNQNMNIHQVRMVRTRGGNLSWGEIPESVRAAFITYRIVVVPSGTKLWKMTQYGFNGSRVSPWWCAVNGFEEDTMGIAGSLREAAFNGVSPQIHIRCAAAVRFDWNMLSELQQITLTADVKGLWGQFAPQPLLSPGVTMDLGEEGKNLPNTLGGFGAWQFWIPNLTSETCRLDFS